MATWVVGAANTWSIPTSAPPAPTFVSSNSQIFCHCNVTELIHPRIATKKIDPFKVRRSHYKFMAAAVSAAIAASLFGEGGKKRAITGGDDLSTEILRRSIC